MANFWRAGLACGMLLRARVDRSVWTEAPVWTEAAAWASSSGFRAAGCTGAAAAYAAGPTRAHVRIVDPNVQLLGAQALQVAQLVARLAERAELGAFGRVGLPVPEPLTVTATEPGGRRLFRAQMNDAQGSGRCGCGYWETKSVVSS